MLAVGVLLAAWVLLGGRGGTLSAQTRPERAPPIYQYVGVEQSIARIDTATGRIEVLSKRGEPKASLLMPGSRPWEWREVPVETRRHQEEDKEEPRGEGAKQTPDAAQP